MIAFVKKVFDFGVRRVFVILMIRIILTFKKILYFYFFSDNKPSARLKSIVQPTQFVGRGKIEVSRKSQVGVWPSPLLLSTYSYLEARDKGAKIFIGNETYINNSAIIIADKTSIYIGNNCLIGMNVNIFDSDFHGVELEDRSGGKYECQPVVIEDNVFIGSNVTILKGVRIGEGSVIANSATVIKNVDPYTVVAGIPAKKVRALKNEDK